MFFNQEKRQSEINPIELGEIFYDRKKASSYSYEAYFSFFKIYLLPHLPTDKKVRILDVGCGGGQLLYALKKEGYNNHFGIDSSKNQIERAKEKMDRVECVDVFEYLPNHQNAFDVVTLIDVAEHFDKGNLFKLMKIIQSTLRPGGILIIHTVNGLSPFSRPYFFGDPTHQQLYSPKMVGEYALLAGFEQYRQFPSAPEYFPRLEPVSLKSFVYFLLKVGQWFLWHILSRIYAFVEGVAIGGYGRFYTPNFIIVCKKFIH